MANWLEALFASVTNWRWNDVRLARSIGLWRGYPLYPGRDSQAPIIGTMHGPVAHLLYGGIGFLKDPTRCLLAACALSSVLYFGSILWLQLRGTPKLAGTYGFLAAAALLIASPGARYGALTVHVDAAALCCSVLAAGLLLTGAPLRDRTLAASAIFAMLAVASKQTMAPVAFALPCFVLVADGKRAFARYLAVQAAAAVVIFAAMLALFRPARDLLFNTFTLAIRQPRTASIASRIVGGMSHARNELAAAAAPLLFLIAVFAFAPGRLREKIGQNCWVVFLWMAALQLPIELRASSTDGGGVNHLGVVTLFAALAATCGLIQFWKSDSRPELALAARMLLVGIILVGIADPFEVARDFSRVRSNATQTAYDYQLQHPGRAYFPANPLAGLLATGKLTHFDDALLDRELAGFPIAPDQLAAGLPASFQVVAYPPGQKPHARVLRGWLADKPLLDDPELPQWRVYQVKPAAIRLTSTR